MDNQVSRPTLALPTIPLDFEATAGNSRVDFAKALFALLSGSTIEGINPDNPTPYDLGTMQAEITVLQNQIAALNTTFAYQSRLVTRTAIPTGDLTVSFDAMPTANFAVSVSVLKATDPDFQWAIIPDSKSTTEVSLRISGTGPFDIEVHIFEVK